MKQVDWNQYIGKKFNKLTIKSVTGLKPYREKKYATYGLCQCECGNVAEFPLTRVKNGYVKSCGCMRVWSYSTFGERRRKTNKYILSGEYGIGFTTNTNVEFYFDLEDYDKIKNYCWFENIRTTGYHALVTRLHGKEDKVVTMAGLLGMKNFDHIDRNPMNNRKENLRKATALENARNASLYKNNSSGITGVYYCNTTKRWVALIYYRSLEDKKKTETHHFLEKEDAIRCRLQMEHDYYGEFAPQKHLFAQYGIEEDGEK